MNSFKTIFMQFIRDTQGRKWYEQYQTEYKINYTDEMYGLHYIMENIDVWCSKSNDYVQKCFDALNKFASLTHCLANMILVPQDFNKGRYAKTKDFWDLSLIYLYEDDEQNWYIKEYKKELFLDDWFDGNRVRLLFTGHSIEDHPMPKEKEYLKCLNEINSRIEKRAKRLAECDKLKDFKF